MRCRRCPGCRTSTRRRCAWSCKAQQLARNWDQVLALLPQLEKRKVFEPALLEQFKRYAQTENLKRKALDAKTLARVLGPAAGRGPQGQPRRGGRGPDASSRWAAAHEAHGIIEQSLEADWDSALLPLYVECLPRDARRHLERAESWLQAASRAIRSLLLALGQLCMQQELWGKARSYLEASLAIEPSHTAYVQLGKLLERIGKPEEASRCYRRGLELALASSRKALAADAGSPYNYDLDQPLPRERGGSPDTGTIDLINHRKAAR